MAEVKQVETSERWKAQRLAKTLDGEIRELKVALSELDSVRPNKATYVRRAGVFFLDKHDAIVKAKQGEIKTKERQRREVGMQLRPVGSQL